MLSKPIRTGRTRNLVRGHEFYLFVPSSICNARVHDPACYPGLSLVRDSTGPMEGGQGRCFIKTVNFLYLL